MYIYIYAYIFVLLEKVLISFKRVNECTNVGMKGLSAFFFDIIHHFNARHP